MSHPARRKSFLRGENLQENRLQGKSPKLGLSQLKVACNPVLANEVQEHTREKEGLDKGCLLVKSDPPPFPLRSLVVFNGVLEGHSGQSPDEPFCRATRTELGIRGSAVLRAHSRPGTEPK